MAKRQEKKVAGGEATVAVNRKARFNYELLDDFEAGLVLAGTEVRSLRENGADLTDAWVEVDTRGEAWVKGMRIPPLKHAGVLGHEERRKRKLLLHAEQSARLKGKVEREGLTCVATKLYFKNNRAKLAIALARGKKQHDKRQTMRERDADREARQAIARGRKGE